MRENSAFRVQESDDEYDIHEAAWKNGKVKRQWAETCILKVRQILGCSDSSLWGLRLMGLGFTSFHIMSCFSSIL